MGHPFFQPENLLRSPRLKCFIHFPKMNIRLQPKNYINLVLKSRSVKLYTENSFGLLILLWQKPFSLIHLPSYVLLFPGIVWVLRLTQTFPNKAPVVWSRKRQQDFTTTPLMHMHAFVSPLRHYCNGSVSVYGQYTAELTRVYPSFLFCLQANFTTVLYQFRKD